MMTSSEGRQLPFEVLGKIGPILCWVEGDSGPHLPSSWSSSSIDYRTREREWLLQELPTFSYDNVEDIVHFARADMQGRKRSSFQPISVPRLRAPQDYDLKDAFQSLSQHYFVWNGGEMCVREGRMEELHELGLRFPVGHLIRHGHARAVARRLLSIENALDLPEEMSLLPSNSFGLRTVVRRGLSENHLHLTGVTSAEEHWADSLLKAFSPSSLQVQSSAERRLLALNLAAGRVLALAVLLARWQKDACPLMPTDLLRVFDRLYFARTPLEERQAAQVLSKRLSKILEVMLDNDKNCGGELGRGEEKQSNLSRKQFFQEFGWLLRWINPSSHSLGLIVDSHDLRQASLKTLQDRSRLVQRLHLWAHRLLLSLPRKESCRAFLHSALYRYLICHSHHWQLSTQSGRTTGLKNFHQYYYSKQRGPVDMGDPQYGRLVMERLRTWRGLRVLEGRVGPPRSPRDLLPWILGYAHASTEQRLRKFGLVLHFKKEYEEKEERPLKSATWLRVRWGKRRRVIRAEAVRLYRLLAQVHPVVPFVVGIDAANLELATPPEVFAPAFRFLRELPIRLRGEFQFYADHLYPRREIRNVIQHRRMGLTYHVGEDFRHLLSGLRAIHETIVFLKPHPGDRLGHATALALDPERWAQHNRFQAILPKQEWLDTLVWMHHLLGPGHRLLGELGIEDHIQRLSWQIYSKALRRSKGGDTKRGGGESGKFPENWEGKGQELKELQLERDWSPLTLYDAWYLRQLDPYSIDLTRLTRGSLELKPLAGFSEADKRWCIVQEKAMKEAKRNIGSSNAYVLLALHWLNDDVRLYGAEIELVDMRPQKELWLELCEEVENRMKQIVHEHELVVEVNPSANRIIGPMARYADHHAFELTLDESRQLSRFVRVSVNTDNPAVCNTSLAHEFYLLGEILMGQRVPEAQVVQWLEWLRENGNEYSFVRRMPGPDDPDMHRLLRWLRRIRPSVFEAPTPKEKLRQFWRWQSDMALSHQSQVLYRKAGEAGLDEPFNQALVHQINHLEEQLELLQLKVRKHEKGRGKLPA